MHVTAKEIAQLVARETGVGVEAILAGPRWGPRPVSHARQLAMWLMKRALKRSNQVTGQAFRRDHTIAHYSAQCVELRIRRSRWWREASARLLETTRALQADDAGAIRLLSMRESISHRAMAERHERYRTESMKVDPMIPPARPAQAAQENHP
jgi:hypothetical protein